MGDVGALVLCDLKCAAPLQFSKKYKETMLFVGQEGCPEIIILLFALV